MKWVIGAIGAVFLLAVLFWNSKAASQRPVAFTFYHLPGCKYCDEAKPLWKELQRTYLGPAKLRSVNAFQAQEEVNRLGLNAFPAYILFDRATGHSYKYEGERSAKAFRRFLADNVRG
jgi:thiol-disulfide isomerase/thioredoxin